MEGCVPPCIIGSVSTIFAGFEDFGGVWWKISGNDPLLAEWDNM